MLQQTTLHRILQLLVLTLITSNQLLAGGRVSISVNDSVSKEIEIRVYSTVLTKRYYNPDISLKKSVGKDFVIFDIPKNGEHQYISISLWDKQSYPFYFLVYPSDKISISCKGKQFSISGEGAERFKCQLEIYGLGYKLYYNNDPAFKMTPPERMELELRRIDSVLQTRKSMIEAYNFPKDQQEQVFKEVSVDTWWHKMESYKMSLAHPQAGLDDGIETFYRGKWLNTFPLDEHYFNTATYGEFTFFKIMSDIIAEGYKVPRSEFFVDFISFVKYVHQKYLNSIVHDIILTNAVVRLYKPNIEADIVARNVSNWVKTNMLKNIVDKTIQTLAVNQPAYNFKLPNEKGKMVSLFDFKGKVVVVDYWFTGCTNCLALSKALSEPAKTLMNDSNVVFVSINVDADRKTWLSSLKSGAYTHPGYVTLYTEGKGSDHESVRFYNFQGFPRMLLISKNGKIISLDAPKINIAGSVRSYIDLINKSSTE